MVLATKEERNYYNEIERKDFDFDSYFDIRFKEGKLETAKKMINKGLPLNDISEFTGLFMEELNNLKD